MGNFRHARQRLGMGRGLLDKKRIRVLAREELRVWGSFEGAVGPMGRYGKGRQLDDKLECACTGTTSAFALLSRLATDCSTSSRHLRSWRHARRQSGGAIRKS